MKRLSLIGILSLLVNVGCGEAFVANSSLSSWDTASSGKFDKNCLTSASYNACLVYKNPVAQEGNKLDTALSHDSDISHLQVYGVRLSNLDNSGFLQNSTISVLSASRARAQSKGNRNWKYVFSQEDSSAVGQVMTYYWMQRLVEVMTTRTGEFHAKDKGIKVYTDDSLAGWSSQFNEIYLKNSDSGNLMSMDASIMAHYLGAANLHYASKGAINLVTDKSKHRDCGPTGENATLTNCCTSQIGCSRAIASGVGDYHIALLFPDSPTIGEAWVNSTKGIDHCDFSRDLRDHGTNKAVDAFKACEAEDMEGEIHTMGTLYASIWWSIRMSANDSEKRELDQLFSRHLTVVTGDDDFNTVLEKIKTLDSQMFGGRYTPRFKAEYSKRLI